METTLQNTEEKNGEETDEIISDAEALQLVEETYTNYKQGRIGFEREWYQNILFFLGNQWIIWDTVENRYRKKRLPDWVPTPVTNKFASSGQRIVSVLSRIEPNWTFVPTSDDAADIKAAEQCDAAEELICEENNIESVRQSVASWITYTGNCYLLSGIDPVYESNPDPLPPEVEALGEGIPDEIKPMLQMMDGIEPSQPKLIDGKLYTEVLSPFEAYIDQTIEEFRNQTRILLFNRRSKEYVESRYSVDGKELEEEPGINYLETIGYTTSDPNISNYLAGMNKIKRVPVKRLYVAPDSKYPEGLYIVVAGGIVVEKTVLPKTKQETPKPWIPISHIKFDTVPGAAFGRTPMVDIIQKQMQLNKLDSLIELIALRMSSPIWLLPEGTVMQGFAGQPGAMVRYSQIGDKAKEPNRIPGEQIPASIMQYRASLVEDIEDLASTFEALKGQAPYSGAPGIVIEQLIEQGLTRFGPALRNIAEGYRHWMIHQLEFFRQYGIAERTLAKMGDGSKWTFTKFKGADITGSVNVRIESDSTVPRSSHVEVAKVMQAVESQLVDATDPMTRLKILQKLKLQDLMEDFDRDIVEAVMENEAIEAGQLVQVTPFIDNHIVHINKHKAFAQSDRGRPLKAIIAQHIAEHNMNMDAEMAPTPEAGPQPNKITEQGKESLNPGGPATPPIPEGVAA